MRKSLYAFYMMSMWNKNCDDKNEEISCIATIGGYNIHLRMQNAHGNWEKFKKVEMQIEKSIIKIDSKHGKQLNLKKKWNWKVSLHAMRWKSSFFALIKLFLSCFFFFLLSFKLSRL